jgi:GxxExxY protein
MRKHSAMTQGLIEEDLTYSVIGAGFEVYNTLGFGFLEHVYIMALERELRARGHRVAREYAVVVHYKGEELAMQRLDMVVDDKLIVEVKAAYDLQREAPRQLYNYLRATTFEVGLLLHFGPKGLGRFRLVSSNPTPLGRRARTDSAD